MKGRKLLAAAAALALPAVSASAKLGSTESFLKEIADKILNQIPSSQLLNQRLRSVQLAVVLTAPYG